MLVYFIYKFFFFSRVNDNNVIWWFYRDRNRMRDILNLHLVRDRLNTERIRQGNLHTVSKLFSFSIFK